LVPKFKGREVPFLGVLACEPWKTLEKVGMRNLQFESKLRLNRPRDEVFKFFSDAQNLEEITPPWLQFQVVSKLPVLMHPDAEIEYRLKIHRVPIVWRSRITVWDPPYRFVDEQVRGPYRMWIHEHRFMEDSGGTLCEDTVKYVPLGGAIINSLFVKRDIKKIFAYRSDRLQKILSDPRQAMFTGRRDNIAKF